MAAQNPNNRGCFVSANIYSDSKAGCSCGNKNFAKVKWKGYEVPECKKCGKSPDLFVIAATIIDLSGETKQIKIRHSQSGERLTDIVDCLTTLKQIDIEVSKGTFDIRRYSSLESREGFKFHKITENYLVFHKRRLDRGELTPAGLKDKKSLIDNHLKTYFSETDVVSINDRMIKAFYESYTDRLRTRDKALLELKTILNYAVEDEKLDKLPKFPKVSPSKLVSADKIIDKSQQDKIISFIENELYQKLIKGLSIYGLRPCDLRSLKWKNINLKQGVFSIESHISLNEDIGGRKSQANASLTLPITDDFLAIIKSLPRSINGEQYVFLGKEGGVIGGNVLSRAWNEACKKAKIKGITLYQGTKHSTLSRLAKTASDAQLIKLTGHSNNRMMRRYAQLKTDDIRDLLQ